MKLIAADDIHIIHRELNQQPGVGEHNPETRNISQRVEPEQPGLSSLFPDYNRGFTLIIPVDDKVNENAFFRIQLRIGTFLKFRKVSPQHSKDEMFTNIPNRFTIF